MFIRNAYLLVSVSALAILAVPVRATAQDASQLLAAVRQAMGKALPSHVRLMASGSGYAAGTDPAAPREHYRIEDYVQELDLTSSTASERFVRVDPDGDGTSKPQTETRDVSPGSSWSDQRVFWSTPLGFLAAAASRPAMLRAETFFGTPYQVVTFTVDGGQEVHGYITADNVLERTRTLVDRVPVESVFMSWQDFDGLQFPSLIVQKEDGQLARVLVVTGLAHDGEAGTAQSKRSD